MNPLRDPTSIGTFLDVFQTKARDGIGREKNSPAFKGKERRADMKTGQRIEGALTWRGICEISREANSLSTLLPDAGRCTKVHLAHFDSVLPASRVGGSWNPIRETGHQASVGGTSLQPFAR
jgi:hypothetical protein